MEIDINERLKCIWSQDYFKDLPPYILSREYVYSINNCKKEILITGINPSFRSNECEKSGSFDFQNIMDSKKWDTYWGPIKKMLYDIENNIDLRAQTAYLDIFYFREKNQKILKKELLKNGIPFIIEQLNLTQKIIEYIIQPKLIIVKNRESAAYWGRYSNENIIWMGYELEFIETNNYGDLFKIIGLIPSNQRIAPEILNTNLLNSLILFTNHINQFTSKEKRPTAFFINELLKKSKKTITNKITLPIFGEVAI